MFLLLTCGLVLACNVVLVPSLAGVGISTGWGKALLLDSVSFVAFSIAGAAMALLYFAIQVLGFGLGLFGTMIQDSSLASAGNLGLSDAALIGMTLVCFAALRFVVTWLGRERFFPGVVPKKAYLASMLSFVTWPITTTALALMWASVHHY